MEVRTSSARPGSSELEEDASPSSTSTAASIDDLFLRHKVSKMDTLAGLAVRYNVSVSDIRRANGLLSDTVMYARDTLLIPRRALPVGPEYSTWVGMIVTHYGRLGPGGPADGLPSSSAFGPGFPSARPPTSIQQLRGYYSTEPSRSDTPQYESDGEDRHHLVAGISGRRGGWQSTREVELMARSSAPLAGGDGAAGGAAAAYADDRLRRRRAGEPGDGDPLGEGSSPGRGSSSETAELGLRPAPLFSTQQAPLGGMRPSGASPSSTWSETLLDRMKRVASQPALRHMAVLPAVAPHAASASRLQNLVPLDQQPLVQPLQRSASKKAD